MVYPNITEALVLEFEACDEQWADRYKLIFPTMDFTWPEMLAHADIDDEHKIWLFSLPRPELKQQQALICKQHTDALFALQTEDHAELTAFYDYVKTFLLVADWTGVDEEAMDTHREASINHIYNQECSSFELCEEIFNAVSSLQSEEKFASNFTLKVDKAKHPALVSMIAALDWT